MSKEYVESASLLSDSEKNVIRACSQCNGKMKAVEKVVENSFFILRNTGTRYLCENCDASEIFQSYTTLFLKVMTFILSAGIITAIIINNYLVLLMDLFKESTVFAALALLVSGIALLLITGGIINFISLLKAIRKLAKYPVISGGSRLRFLFIFIVTMLYGLLPWVIFIGFGFLNDLVLHFDKDWAIIPVIIGFTPIFVADKVGISGQAAFFATGSYPVIGLIVYLFS